jgi:hypothetical protein
MYEIACVFKNLIKIIWFNFIEFLNIHTSRGGVNNDFSSRKQLLL